VYTLCVLGTFNLETGEQTQRSGKKGKVWQTPGRHAARATATACGPSATPHQWVQWMRATACPRNLAQNAAQTRTRPDPRGRLSITVARLASARRASSMPCEQLVLTLVEPDDVRRESQPQ
jgi:hypothetical protein